MHTTCVQLRSLTIDVNMRTYPVYLPRMCRTAALGVTLVHELGLGQQPLSATAAAGSTPTHTRSNSSSSLGNSGGGDAATAAAGAAAVGGQSTAAWASALPGIISKFRGAIQTEFPELYAWFNDASLHITVRAIIV
jgi:hypothetical protein